MFYPSPSCAIPPLLRAELRGEYRGVTAGWDPGRSGKLNSDERTVIKVWLVVE
jgi:hypothetical protein